MTMRNDMITIDIKLKPKASRCAVKVIDAKSLEVSVTSPPIDNRANEHLIELLSDVLDVSKSSITIIKGNHSRNKVVSINSLSENEVITKLTNHQK